MSESSHTTEEILIATGAFAGFLLIVFIVACICKKYQNAERNREKAAHEAYKKQRTNEKAKHSNSKLNRSASFDNHRKQSSEEMLLHSNGRIGRNPIELDTESFYQQARLKKGTAVTSDIRTSIKSSEMRQIEEYEQRKAQE